MKIKEAYIEYLNLVNENNTSNKVSVDLPRFIINFNRAQINVVEYILNKRNEDIKRYVSTLLVPNKKLQLKSKSDRYDLFNLPPDFLDNSSLTTFASGNNCSKVRLNTFEIKDENVEELYEDFNNSPSLPWRETFYHFSGLNTVQVFKKDFEIDEVKLNYYRYPKKVEISGYVNSNNVTTTQDIDPEFDDKVVYKILQVMAKNFFANNSDTQSYQVALNQVFSEV